MGRGLLSVAEVQCLNYIAMTVIEVERPWCEPEFDTVVEEGLVDTAVLAGKLEDSGVIHAIDFALRVALPPGTKIISKTAHGNALWTSCFKLDSKLPGGRQAKYFLKQARALIP